MRYRFFSHGDGGGGGAPHGGANTPPPSPPPPSPNPPTPTPAPAPPAPVTAPVPSPAPAALEPDEGGYYPIDDSIPDKPKNWRGSDRAWREYVTARRDAAAAKRAAEEARDAANEADKQRQELTRQLLQSRQDAVMQAAGNDFASPRVRQMFRRDYGEMAAELGEAAPPFEAWFGSEEVRADPLYARFFQASQPPAQPGGAPAPPRPPPPNPDAGAGGSSPPTTATITETQIGVWSRDRTTWEKNRAAAKKALEDQLGRPIGSWRPEGG